MMFSASEPSSRSNTARKARRLLTAVLVSWAAPPGQAQISDLLVTAPQERVNEAAPRGIVTLAFFVRNGGLITRRLAEELELPAGWRRLAEQEPFELGAGQEDVRLVTFQLPSAPSVPAGSYDLLYRLRNTRSPSHFVETSVPFSVKEAARLDVSVQAAPALVVAGRGYEARFLVANTGNLDGNVALTLMSSEGLAVEADAMRFRLGRGQSRLVHALVATDKETRRPIVHQLKLAARMSGQPAVFGQAAARVQIVPLIEQKFDPYRRLQTRSEISAGSESGRKAMQFNWSGGGALDDQGKTRADFHLQQPVDAGVQAFGFRQEFTGSLEGKDGYARAGDRGYSLSPLTMLYEFGRGAQAEAKAGGLAIGGLAYDARSQTTSARRQGGFVAYAPSAALELRANWIEKRAAGRDSIASVAIRSGIAAGLSANAEYAVGRAPFSGAPAGQRAYTARLEGKAAGEFPVLFEKIRAGADFSGYYHDADLTRAAFGAPLTRRLEFNAIYDRQIFNLSRDPARAAALSQARARAGLRFMTTSETALSVEFERQDKKDCLPAPSFDAQAHQAILGVSRHVGALTARLSGAAYRLEDRLSHHSFKQGGAAADAVYALTGRQSYSAFFQSGPQGPVIDSQRETVFGTGADLTPVDDFRIDTQIEHHDSGPAAPQSMRYLGSARWRFLGAQSFSLRFQWIDFLGSERPDVVSALANYSHDFDLPVARRAEFGGLSGVLYDAEKEGRPGLKDVIINVGGSLAATDSRGRFSFRSLKTGEHYVWVDEASLGAGLVTQLKLPLKIDIEGARTRTLDIGVARAASARFHATLFEAEYGPAAETIEEKLVEAGGASGLWLELSRDDETINRATDSDGNLTIRNLRPGLWKVRAGPAGLPERHYVEQPEFQLDLPPGGEQSALLRVLPRPRKIIFLEQK